ncbi:DNA-binding protein [Fundidesulfovibrio terrae]|uniref:DNA-binding protein n=1 Tax=Fundidesulfovibrio terrae TaxID=2922866 RepID=UPI001FAF6914|nr:DNA-binding protein [Fundidesulfovibrio terrae]
MAADLKTFTNALKNAMPQCIKNDEDAAEVITIVGSVITNALKNKDTAYLEGIGEWRSESDGGKKKVIFTPDRMLIDASNE